MLHEGNVDQVSTYELSQHRDTDSWGTPGRNELLAVWNKEETEHGED